MESLIKFTRSLTICLLSLLVSSAGYAKVARVWHGKVQNSKSQEYEKYITDAIKGFSKIKGNQGYALMIDKKQDHTHFMVISYWDSKSSIVAYAGADIEKTHFLPRDKDFLVDPEQTVVNYEIANEVQSAK